MGGCSAGGFSGRSAITCCPNETRRPPTAVVCTQASACVRTLSHIRCCWQNPLAAQHCEGCPHDPFPYRQPPRSIQVTHAQLDTPRTVSSPPDAYARTAQPTPGHTCLHHSGGIGIALGAQQPRRECRAGVQNIAVACGECARARERFSTPIVVISKVLRARESRQAENSTPFNTLWHYCMANEPPSCRYALKRSSLRTRHKQVGGVWHTRVWQLRPQGRASAGAVELHAVAAPGRKQRSLGGLHELRAVTLLKVVHNAHTRIIAVLIDSIACFTPKTVRFRASRIPKARKNSPMCPARHLLQLARKARRRTGHILGVAAPTRVGADHQPNDERRVREREVLAGDHCRLILCKGEVCWVRVCRNTCVPAQSNRNTHPWDTRLSSHLHLHPPTLCFCHFAPTNTSLCSHQHFSRRVKPGPENLQLRPGRP